MTEPIGTPRWENRLTWEDLQQVRWGPGLTDKTPGREVTEYPTRERIREVMSAQILDPYSRQEREAIRWAEKPHA